MSNFLPSNTKVIFNGTCFPRRLSSEVTTNRIKDLVFVGRLVEEKGLSVLIKALSKINTLDASLKVTATIVGDGPQMIDMKKLVKRYALEGQIHFCGEVPNKEIPQVYHAHKLVVVPSIYGEPFGISALEGLMSGCIPIVSNVGGLVEACDNLALTFGAGNSKELAAKIIFALKNYERLSKTCDKNFNFEKYEMKKIAKQYFRELI
jgi:glycosyltransferase involved in cell wall biosynthesis